MTVKPSIDRRLHVQSHLHDDALAAHGVDAVGQGAVVADAFKGDIDADMAFRLVADGIDEVFTWSG